MKRLFEFKCADNHVSEALVSTDVTAHPCKTCGLEAQRIVSAVRSRLDAISGDFPGATIKWAKNREKQIKHERKTNSEG